MLGPSWLQKGCHSSKHLDLTQPELVCTPISHCFQKPQKVSPQVPLAISGVCAPVRSKRGWNLSLVECEWWFPGSLCSPETGFSLQLPGICDSHGPSPASRPQVCLLFFGISLVPASAGYSLPAVLDLLSPPPPCSVLQGLAVPETVKVQLCLLSPGGTGRWEAHWRSEVSGETSGVFVFPAPFKQLLGLSMSLYKGHSSCWAALCHSYSRQDSSTCFLPLPTRRGVLVYHPIHLGLP